MDIFFFQRIEGALEDCISVEIESHIDTGKKRNITPFA